MGFITGAAAAIGGAAKAIGAAKIASAAGTAISGGLNYASQMRINAQNRRQAEIAYERQRDAIREMNAYNSPSMQVARLKAAGLSPTLAYGGNGEAVGNQSEIPEYSAIPAESPSYPDMGASFIDAARYGLESREQMNRDNLAVAELAVKSAQSFMYTTSADLNEAQKQEIIELLGFKKQAYFDESMLSQGRYAEIMQNIEESKSRIDLNDKEIERLDSLINLQDVQASEILALLPARLLNMDADTVMKQAQAGLLTAEVDEVAEKVATLQFNRQFDRAKFKREGVQYNNEVRRWEAEQKLRIQQGHADRVTSVFRVLLGGTLVGVSPALQRAYESGRTVVSPLGQ